MNLQSAFQRLRWKWVYWDKFALNLFEIWTPPDQAWMHRYPEIKCCTQLSHPFEASPCFPGYQTYIFFYLYSGVSWWNVTSPSNCYNYLLLSKKRSFLCSLVVWQWMNTCFSINMKQPHLSKEHCHATEVQRLSLGWWSSTISTGCERRVLQFC